MNKTLVVEHSSYYGGYYVFMGNSIYLHNDGIPRNSCLDHNTNEYTGYFTTREQAQEAIDTYLGKEDGFVVVKILASDLPELQMELVFLEVQ